MPTYAYRCRQCGHDLEVVQAFTDDPMTVCPECQGALRKLFSPVGISFKGGGFYKTDSRGSSSAPAKDGAAAKESGSSSSSSDSSSSSTSTPTTTPSTSSPSNGSNGSSGSTPSTPTKPTPSAST